MSRTSAQNAVQADRADVGRSLLSSTSLYAMAASSATPEAPRAPSLSPGGEERYINRLQLRVLIPTSDMTLWRWQRDPDIAFPAPVKLGADGRNYWWLPSVRAWARQRAERQVATPASGRHSATTSCEQEEQQEQQEQAGIRLKASPRAQRGRPRRSTAGQRHGPAAGDDD
jgi:hypothetical protein